MANGIKLRRGLKTALATTIADGEFVFCSDTGELGFKKGTSEVYVDLESLPTAIGNLQTNVSGLQTNVSGLQTNVSGLQTNVSGLQTDVSGLQTDVSELLSHQVSLLPRQFKVSVNKFYNFELEPATKPANNGYFRIPLAKLNPLVVGEVAVSQQVFYFSNVNVKKYDFDNTDEFRLQDLLIDYALVEVISESTTSLSQYPSASSRGLGLQLTSEGTDNGIDALWLEVPIDGTDDTTDYTTHKLMIAFDMYYISEVWEDSNHVFHNIYLPPLGLEVTSYDGA